MTNDPLAAISTRETPQSQPIPGRTDMVANSAGGFTFAADDWTRLRRFLILGTEGGSFYASERSLTKENADVVLRCVAADGARTVDEIVQVSVDGLAPRQSPTIFALAVCAASDSALTRARALDALPKVCRIGTHLFLFARYVELFRGWGRGLRRAVASWYTERPLDGTDAAGGDLSPLALQVVKYRQREGWSHRDLLRLSHPVTSDPRRQAVFQYALGKEEIGPGLPELITAAEAASKTTDVKELVKLIEEHRLPWEVLPSETLREPAVWEALLPSLGYTALIRNVARLSSIGLLKPMSNFEGEVTKRLLNQDGLQKARVHPFAILLAQTTYAAGRGVKGSMTWSPTPKVVDALDTAFYLAFKNVEPSGKRFMIALDISGSMTWNTIMNTHIYPREASAAMALVTLATEPYTMVTTFSSPGYGRVRTSQPTSRVHGIQEVPLSPRMRLDDVVRTVNGMYAGGTDCALPMLYAQDRGYEIDTFVVYTDSETWAGHPHPAQALERYRQKMGRDARLVVVGMVSNGFTIADPKDPGMLDLVGFDASAPQLISRFSAGQV